MALPKQHDNQQDEQPEPRGDVVKSAPPPDRLFGRSERLRAIFDDLREHAPPEGEDDGWEEFKRALDEHRPEGAKLFPDTSFSISKTGFMKGEHMALPKQQRQQQHGAPLEEEQPDSDQTQGKRLFGPVERLRMIHEDLLEYAPPEGEDDGWEELAEALDAERPEGMKLFPK